MSDVAPRDRRHGPWFWVSVVAGASIASVGVRTFFDTYADAPRRFELAKWIIGSDIVHDAFIVPATIAIGVLVHRFVPVRVRPAVQFGAIATGTLLLLAWRPLEHSGAGKHNLTVQPLDYTTATATALAVVWLIALVWAALISWHNRAPRS
jgi:hypothetical protein